MVAKIFKRFNRQDSLTAASVLLVVTLALSNLLGMFRDHFLAQKLPTSALDIYYAAFRIPDTIFNILILGAIASAFIPVFSGFYSQGEKAKAWRLTSNIINIGFVLLILFCAILYFAMPGLIGILVPKFDADRMSQTIHLSRLLLFTPILFGLSYIFGGVLNATKRFFAYSLAPLFYNLAIIFGAVCLVPIYGLVGAVYGVIFGAFLHMLVQLISLCQIGFKWSLVLEWRDEAVRRIGKLMLWRTLSLSSQQLSLFFFTAIGSALAAGSIAIFNLANNIQTLPTVVFGTAFSTAVFPVLTENIALGNRDEFLGHLSKTLKIIFFLMIPSTVGLILLRAQIIRLVLGSGFFNWDDTARAATVLTWFAVSLLAQGPVNLMARAFYALHDTKTPAIYGLLFFITSVVFAYPLAHFYGVAGLAMAFSLASFVQFGGLYWRLGHKHGIHLEHKQILADLIKGLIAGLAMALTIYLAKRGVVYFIDLKHFINVFIQAIISGGLGIFVFFVVAKIFKMKEYNWVINYALKRD